MRYKCNKINVQIQIKGFHSHLSTVRRVGYISRMDDCHNHPIQVAARRTGLSPHVLRVWERRYGAVAPHRDTANHRFYSDADIERLQLLQRGITMGRAIGQIARLSTEDLRALVAGDVRESKPVRRDAAAAPSALQSDCAALYERCCDATARMDSDALERTLQLARVTISRTALMESVIVPLMDDIGVRWHGGALRPAHEHVATAVVRTFLGNVCSSHDLSEDAPRIVIGTPAGQWHEIGALVVAATAAAEGWRVTYLGPNLPAEDVAAAALACGAIAVSLSVVYPADDVRLHGEFEQLRRGLGPGIALLVGGRAAGAYRATVEAVDGVVIEDLAALRRGLEALRAARRPA